MLPPSKSIALRLLSAAFVADYLAADESTEKSVCGSHCGTYHILNSEGESSLFDNILTECQRHGCDDIEYLDYALCKLRECMGCANGRYTDIYIGEGAAPLRFFTAIAASIPGVRLRIFGSGRLPFRPVSGLADALRDAGADIRLLTERGETKYFGNVKATAIIEINGRKLLNPEEIMVDVSQSSQFLSALMLASPLWKNPVYLKFKDSILPVSYPYIDMTYSIMKSLCFGLYRDNSGIYIAGGEDICSDGNCPQWAVCENDWSSASYLYEMVALFEIPELRIPGLFPPEDSLQGDSVCAVLFEKLCVSTEFDADGAILRYNPTDKMSCFEWDMASCPDLVPALFITAAISGVRTKLTGVRNLRYKESDRPEVLKEELAKLRIPVRLTEDSIEVDNSVSRDEDFDIVGNRDMILLDSHGDHRIAMSLAPLHYLDSRIMIPNLSVVTKSYPGFLNDLNSVFGNFTACKSLNFSFPSSEIFNNPKQQ